MVTSQSKRRRWSPARHWVLLLCDQTWPSKKRKEETRERGKKVSPFCLIQVKPQKGCGKVRRLVKSLNSAALDVYGAAGLWLWLNNNNNMNEKVNWVESSWVATNGPSTKKIYSTAHDQSVQWLNRWKRQRASARASFYSFLTRMCINIFIGRTTWREREKEGNLLNIGMQKRKRVVSPKKRYTNLRSCASCVFTPSTPAAAAVRAQNLGREM